MGRRNPWRLIDRSRKHTRMTNARSTCVLRAAAVTPNAPPLSRRRFPPTSRPNTLPLGSHGGTNKVNITYNLFVYKRVEKEKKKNNVDANFIIKMFIFFFPDSEFVLVSVFTITCCFFPICTQMFCQKECRPIL